MWRRLFILFAVCAVSAAPSEKTIDVQRSTILIHVGKAGMFSAAGHEHWVAAPIASGSFNDSGTPSVEFKVEAAKMKVKADPKLSEKDQAQVQKDMQGRVLESSRYPEITFRSTHAEKTGEGWRVEGKLTLHGATHPVSVSVKKSGDAYVGRAAFKQTDFGIKPISAGGGTIKVKDELGIEFKIFAKP